MVGGDIIEIDKSAVIYWFCIYIQEECNVKEITKNVRNGIVYVWTNKRKIEGENNRIIKNNNSYIRNTHILIHGNNNILIFGENSNICGLSVLITGNENIIEIGKNVVINASTIQPTVINAVGGG